MYAMKSTMALVAVLVTASCDQISPSPTFPAGATRQTAAGGHEPEETSQVSPQMLESRAVKLPDPVIKLPSPVSSAPPQQTPTEAVKPLVQISIEWPVEHTARVRVWKSLKRSAGARAVEVDIKSGQILSPLDGQALDATKYSTLLRLSTSEIGDFLRTQERAEMPRKAGAVGYIVTKAADQKLFTIVNRSRNNPAAKAIAVQGVYEAVPRTLLRIIRLDGTSVSLEIPI